MPLYQLIYESRAACSFTEAELLELLQHARHYNAQHGIGGILLHSAKGRFLQVLEGEQAAVLALYHRIVRDPRHDTCTILVSGPLAARRFGEWRMGFRAAHHERDLTALLGQIDTSSPDFLFPLAPRLSGPLLDRLLNYIHYTPPHATLEER